VHRWHLAVRPEKRTAGLVLAMQDREDRPAVLIHRSLLGAPKSSGHIPLAEAEAALFELTPDTELSGRTMERCDGSPDSAQFISQVTTPVLERAPGEEPGL